MNAFVDALVVAAESVHRLKTVCPLTKNPYVMFMPSKDWNVFRQKTLVEAIAANIDVDTTHINDSELVVASTKFMLAKRPTPMEVQLQTRTWVKIDPELSIIRAIRFNDRSEWDAHDGWK